MYSMAEADGVGLVAVTGDTLAGQSSLIETSNVENLRESLDFHAGRLKLLEELDAMTLKLAEKTAEVELVMREQSVVPTLRSQLDEVSQDRDRVKASHLHAEVELERTREALQKAREDLRNSQEKIQEQAEELAVLRKQVQDHTSDREFLKSEKSRLEADLKAAKATFKKMADASAKGSRRPGSGNRTHGIDFVQHRPYCNSNPVLATFGVPETYIRTAKLSSTPPPHHRHSPYPGDPEQELAELSRDVVRLAQEIESCQAYPGRSEGRRKILEEEYSHLVNVRIPELEKFVKGRSSSQLNLPSTIAMPQPTSWPAVLSDF